MGKEEPLSETSDIYRAEISMYSLDYERYHSLLKKADELAILVLNEDPAALRPYFSVLLTIYINFRPLFLKGVDETCKKVISEINAEFEIWRKKNRGNLKFFPTSLAHKLFSFHSYLLTMKQLCGLGIKVEKEESFYKKLKKVSSLE